MKKKVYKYKTSLKSCMKRKDFEELLTSLFQMDRIQRGDKRMKKVKKTKLDILDPSKDPLGYTDKEIRDICKERGIPPKEFNKAFGVNTVAVGKDGKSRYYQCDVERALYRLGRAGGKFHLWD